MRPNGRMLGIGMALPGPFGVESMSFVGPTTMAGWEDVALRERLAEATGLPAFLETDMAAAALGEQLYGLGTELLGLLLPLSSASASAAPWCMRARVMRGAWGNAGEIGHIPAVPDGEPCPCGNRGCLERYLSLEALRRAGGERSRLGARRGADLPQRDRHRSRTCSIPRRWCSAAWRRRRCSTAWPRVGGGPAQLRSRPDATATAARHRGARRRARGAARRRGACRVRRAVAALRPDVHGRPRARRLLDGKGIAA